MWASVFTLLLQHGKTIVTEISDNIDNRGVKASGKTQKALRYEVEETDSGEALTVWGPKYIQVLEDGRGPTKRSAKGSPTLVETIKKWIDDKGLSIPDRFKTKDSFAFAIARSIHKHGTNLYRSGGHSGVLSDVINNERADILRRELQAAGYEDLSDKIREDIINVNSNTAS